jgi:hypothetical protein
VDREQVESEQRQDEPRAAPAPVARAPLPQVQLASAIGNHAFTAMIARNGPDAATAAPPAAAPAWRAPMDLGTISTQERAAEACARLALEAGEMMEMGFRGEFRLLHEEAMGRAQQWREGGATALTANEVEQLSQFGQEFHEAHQAALREVAGRIVAQLLRWNNPPLTEDDLFELREATHERFTAGDEGALEQIAEFGEKIEEITGAINDWVGYGATAIGLVRQAERLEQIQEAIDGIHSRIEEATQIITLARDVARLAGAIGDGPTGPDPIAQVEAGLGVMDFVVGRFEVPGITQLWNGYILEGARAALRGLRHVLDTYYQRERGSEVRFFFDQNRRRAQAPNIIDSLARYGNLSRHFPGGQPVFDYMWQVMRGESPSLPDDVEDYFVENMDVFNAGMGRTNQIETDSSVGNLWNVFTRTESPNLRAWIRDNKDEVWERLYGGMPTPL